jgi:hypothetical protein
MYKDIEDMLRNAKGADIPSSTLKKADETLQNLEYRKEERYMKTKIMRYVSIAAAVLLCVTTAYAAVSRTGILDFLGNSVLPTAPIQTGVEQEGGQTEYADFTLREAVFDGAAAYLAFSVTPKKDDVVLLHMDSDVSKVYSDDKTVLKIAIAAIGRSNRYQFADESDGTVVVMIDGEYVDGGRKTLDCFLTPIKYANGEYVPDMANRVTTQISFNLENTSVFGTAVSGNAAVFADCGARVDRVALRASEMAVYADVEYTVVDESKYEDGLAFHFLDANGDPLPYGAVTYGGTEALDGSGVKFVYKTSMQATEALPEKVTLKAWNIWSREKYETHTFNLN